MTLRDEIASVLWGYAHSPSEAYEAIDAILALPQIVDLQKKLAEVEAERDQLGKGIRAYRDWWAEADNRADAAEAAIPRAYQMGVDAAVKHIFTMEHDGTKPDWIALGRWAFTIEQAAGRAGQVQPPVDLVQQATKGTDHA